MSSTSNKISTSTQLRENSKDKFEKFSDLEMNEIRPESEDDEPKISKNRRQEALSESAAQLRDATVSQIGREGKFLKLFWLLIYIGLFLLLSVSLNQIVKNTSVIRL